MGDPMITDGTIRLPRFRVRRCILKQLDVCISQLQHHDLSRGIFESDNFIDGLCSYLPRGGPFFLESNKVSIKSQCAFNVSGRNRRMMDTVNHRRPSFFRYGLESQKALASVLKNV